MITRIVTPDGRKGITVAKEDGRAYRVIAEQRGNEEIDGTFRLSIRDLTGNKDSYVDERTYPEGDLREIQAAITHDFIVNYKKEELNTLSVIEDYMEHYWIHLKEVDCTKCHCNLGYLEGNYVIVCNECGELHRS